MPGALTWDPTPAGGDQSTFRGGLNPSADGAIAALQALAAGAGISPSALFYLGDSQLGYSAGANTLTAASYDSNTGVLTLTQSGHGLTNGCFVQLGARAAPQWNVYGKSCTVVSSSIFTVQLAAGLSGQPIAADMRWTKAGTSNKPACVGDVQYLTGARGRVVRNASVTGETWAQIRARVALEVAPVMTGGGIVIIQGGHNDSLTGPVPVAQSISDMQGCVSDLKALGLRVIIINNTPFGSGYATTAARVHLLEQNRAMAALARPGTVAVVDAFGVANDPASLCNALTGYVQSDNLHWSGKTSRGIAQLIANIINLWLPPVQRLPGSFLDCYDVTNNPNSTNKMQNALFQTATGGTLNNSIAGAAASQLTLATDQGSGASFTGSVQATSWGGGGNSQKIAWASLTFSTNTVRMYTSSQHARFSAGQKIRFACRVKTTGLGGSAFINDLYAKMYITVDGNALTLALFNDSSLPAAQNDQQDWDGLFESDLIYLPVGAALQNLQWEIGAVLTGTLAGSIEVGQVDLIQVA